ncbi:histidine kinase [Spirosoma soli]|uniref:Histidine kinase n=1 Tax=Spirosoma soli TaxID=1770529 RepID=A0ABW5LXM7_9BACT
MASFTAYTTLRLFLDGMLTMMGLYALLSYFQQRKAIYWQYALYIACMVIDLRLSDVGYAKPDYLPGAFYPETFVETVAYMLYIRFTILLINPAEQDPIAYRVMQALIIAFAIALALDTVLYLANASAAVRSGIYMGERLLMTLVGLYLIPRFFRLRNNVVSYFIAGSLLLVLGSIAALLTNYLPPENRLQPDNAFTFPVTLLQIGVVGEVLFFTLGMSLRNRENEREKIQYQAQLIEQLRENERKQERLQRIRDDIARDLHDDVGADLSGISLLSQVAARQVDEQPDQAQATLKVIRQRTRRVVATMREIVWSLNSAQTSLESFSYRLQETAGQLFEHQSTVLHLQLPVDDADWTLPAEGRRDLFLMVKEMLHNVIRHADAQNAYLTLWVEQNMLCIAVRDDGQGFVVQLNGNRVGNGLRSMQQRAAAINGQLMIESIPGIGTTVTFRCPLTLNELAVV